MAITEKFSFLIAAAALATPVSGITPTPDSTIGPNPTFAQSTNELSFDSGLWKSRYLDADRVIISSSTLPENSPVVGHHASGSSAENIAQRLTDPHAQQLMMTAAIRSVGESAAAADNDNDMVVSGDDSGRRLAPLTAWQIANATVGGTPADANLSSNGPTVTIYLVGLVAVIVLGGTVLSGRR